VGGTVTGEAVVGAATVEVVAAEALVEVRALVVEER
jgi:hypothetical protein